MPAPSDHPALAQRFRPYYKFSSDPGHGGEKVRPVAWEWFVSRSDLSQGGEKIYAAADLAKDPTLILRVIGPKGVSDLRNAPNKDHSFVLTPDKSQYGGQAWTDIAGSGAGLYAQVEEAGDNFVVLIYWQLFMYNSGTGGPAFDHAGDIAAVSLVYDRTRDMLVRANFVMHGAVLEEFDLQAPQYTGPGTLTGVAVNGGKESVETNVLHIAPDHQYQNGPAWHSPTNPAVVSFARDPVSGKFEHLVAFIEWGTHEPWPSTTGSVMAAPQHNGNDVSFLPATVRYMGSMTNPTPSEAPLLFFNGRWGNPPGFLFHRISFQPAAANDPSVRIADGNMTDRNPYCVNAPNCGGLAWPPPRETEAVQAKVTVSCAGDKAGAQVALRWGHPDHDKNEYFPLWTIKPGAVQQKQFALPDTNSELEIQTEGGDGTSYSVNIWVNVGNGMPAQPSIVLNHKVNGVVDQDFVQNNVAVKRSSALNKYGEQNVRIDTSHAAPGAVQ